MYAQNGSSSTALFNGDTELHTAAGSTTASAVRTYTGYSGVPVAERTTTAGVTGNTLYWLFTDLDGTVTAQVNQATGAIAHRYVDPFGNPIGTTPTGWSDHHGFLNKVTDTTTGLTLIGARDYDPSLGRFTSVDPVFTAGNPLQDNGYAYAGNNPITNTDPTGLLGEQDYYSTGEASGFSAADYGSGFVHQTEMSYGGTSFGEQDYYSTGQASGFTSQDYDHGISFGEPDFYSTGQASGFTAQTPTQAYVPPGTNSPGTGSGGSITAMHDWAASTSGRDTSFYLSSASLAASIALPTVGSLVGGPWGAAAGEVAGDITAVVLGAGSTAIDCLAEVTSPACTLGAASLALGEIGVDPLDIAKHVKLVPKILGAFGLGGTIVNWAVSFNDWLYRGNFGNG
jgi:RHS repeat-associated protein